MMLLPLSEDNNSVFVLRAEAALGTYLVFLCWFPKRRFFQVVLGMKEAVFTYFIKINCLAEQLLVLL